MSDQPMKGCCHLTNMHLSTQTNKTNKKDEESSPFKKTNTISTKHRRIHPTGLVASIN